MSNNKNKSYGKRGRSLASYFEAFKKYCSKTINFLTSPAGSALILSIGYTLFESTAIELYKMAGIAGVELIAGALGTLGTGLMFGTGLYLGAMALKNLASFSYLKIKHWLGYSPQSEYSEILVSKKRILTLLKKECENQLSNTQNACLDDILTKTPHREFDSNGVDVPKNTLDTLDILDAQLMFLSRIKKYKIQHTSEDGCNYIQSFIDQYKHLNKPSLN